MLTEEFFLEAEPSTEDGELQIQSNARPARRPVWVSKVLVIKKKNDKLKSIKNAFL